MSQTNLVLQPDPQSEEQEIKTHGNALIEAAKDITILDAETYESSAAILRNIKAYITRAKEFCRPNITRWHAGWKKALEDEKKLISPYEEAEKILKPKLGAYHDMLERQRREEEERARQEALKHAEELRLQDAVAAEQLGQPEVAESILGSPSYVPAVVVPKVQPNPQGVSFRENYKADVYDAKALILAVAQGKIPAAAIDVNMSFLNGQARALKGAMNYPGVRVVCEKVVAAGRK